MVVGVINMFCRGGSYLSDYLICILGWGWGVVLLVGGVLLGGVFKYVCVRLVCFAVLHAGPLVIIGRLHALLSSTVSVMFWVMFCCIVFMVVYLLYIITLLFLHTLVLFVLVLILSFMF